MTQLGTTQSTVVATNARLSCGTAIWNAFRSRAIDFYPRIAEGGGISTVGTLAVVQEMEKACARWATLDNSDALKNAIDLAKQSLAEVKAQTEYQDQKATRLLTVTTFLSALSGALFSRYMDAYPIYTITGRSFESAALLGCGYATFAAFVVASLSGALVTFHATRTRFKYPPYQTTEDQEKDPESLLFFGGLIRSRPSAWTRGWVTAEADGGLEVKPMLRDDLRRRYFQHLVSETYLVAAKTADKLRYLEPAQSLLAISLRCLFVWLLLLAPISILVPPTKSPTKPIEATLSSAPLPSPQRPIVAPTEPTKNGTPPVVVTPAIETTGQRP